MADQLTEERWAELQFYYLCSDLLAYRNNLMDVYDTIDSLGIFGKYSPEHVKLLAQELLSILRYRPSKEEFIILAHSMGVSIKEIKRRTGAHNRTIYQAVDENQKNPRLFYPRFRTEQIRHIKDFIDTFNNFRKVGVILD